MIYVLNNNLQKIGIVDNYQSLIWSKRYRERGDCELYLPANTDTVNLLKQGRYIIRDDDDMVCRIKKTEVTTDADAGDYLTVTAYDVKDILEQRIVWGMQTADGNAEDFARRIIDGAVGETADPARQILKPDGSLLFRLGPAAGFDDVTTEQIDFANVGQKVVEWCKRHEWGSRVTLSDGGLWFTFYRGTDRSETVIFSPDYENLSTTDYIVDATDMGNVSLVGAEGGGFNRVRGTVGAATGIDRYEFFIDARDLSTSISLGEIKATYPDGTVEYNNPDAPTWPTDFSLSDFDLYIYDDEHLAWLQNKYPGREVVVIDDKRYYHFNYLRIAKFDDPQAAWGEPDDAALTLLTVIYMSYLLAAAYGKIAEHGEKTEFNGSVEPNITFKYKRDYFLGDLVTVKNNLGISLKARIVEVTEVDDTNGYTVNPIFEYLTEE